MPKRILIMGVGFALSTLAIAAAGSLAMSTSANAATVGRSASMSSGRSMSIGMTRPNITNTVRVPSTPSPTMSSSANYNPRPSYAAPPTPQAHIGSVVTSQSVQHVSAASTGSSFMSSMGGAFAGSMLGNMISGSHGSGGTTVVNNGSPGGAAAPAVMASGMSAPGGSTVIMQAPASASPLSMFLSLLGWFELVACVVALTYLAWRMVKQAQSYSSVLRNTGANMPDADDYTIDFSLVERFLQINRALAKRDSDALSRLVSADMLGNMSALFPDEPYHFTALVAYEVIDTDRRDGLMSVFYTGEDLHNKEAINEVWHYKRHGDAWLLAGVENINA